MSSTAPDSELKARHRAMWASGDYPSMVTTFLLPLGTRLVDACGIGQHFKDRYGPTIVARGNAVKNGREDEFDQALNDFCDEWNRGHSDGARFQHEYLVAAVGTRT